MNSVEVLFANGILYTCTLLYFYKKYKMSVGLLIWMFYTVSAWASFLFVQQPEYALSITHASVQTIFPCIYLYVVLVIAMAPFMRMKEINDIDYSNMKLLRYIIILCTIVQILFIVVDIPAVVRVLKSGSSMLNEFRSTVYGSDESISLLVGNRWLNRLKNLYSGIRIPATGLSIITLFTCRKDRKLMMLFAISALLNNIRIIIVEVSRGEIVLVFLLYICAIFLIRGRLSKEEKKVIVAVFLPVVIVGILFFWVITVARFGTKANFFMYKYIGEPINNFNGILFYNVSGSTNGKAYFSILYQLFAGQSGPSNANEKWALIQSSTGVRGDIFYTWVGALIIEFGKIIPLFVTVVLNRIGNMITSIDKYKSGDLIIVLFFINFYIRGIFNFPTQNLEGFLMITYTIILFLIFRINKQSGKLILTLPKG